jgi:hypothetical protein
MDVNLPTFFALSCCCTGMVDVLVASRGRYFIGCWFSTFTGYSM